MGLLAVLAAAGVGAQVYFSPDTGSHYEVIRTPVTWKAANDLAQARSYNGRPGHLASVTSLAEHQFLLTIGDLNGLWIGGIQKPGSSTSAGWNWTTAEVSNFTRWNPGEPNDLSGTSEDESHTEYAANGSGGFGWNDVSASRVNPGLIVEYSGNSAVRYSPSTGSWYQIVQQPGITLAQARQAAATRSYFGHAGRLATITTPFENRFVNFMGDLDRMWIGLSQPVSSSTARDDWEWDSGETFVYSNWDIGQPNNAGNNEGGLTYFGGWAGNRRWHDWGATSTNTRGVLIEFQGPKPDQRLVGWGRNWFDAYPAGQGGGWDRHVPVAHGTRIDAEILDMGLSPDVILAADSLGRVWTWGDQPLAVGRSEQLAIPTLKQMPSRVARVDADWQLEMVGEIPLVFREYRYASSVLTVDRNLWIWGEALAGRTPAGGNSDTPSPATRPGPFLDADLGSLHYSGVQLSNGAPWMVGDHRQLDMTRDGNQAVQIWTDGAFQEEAGPDVWTSWTRTAVISPAGNVSIDESYWPITSTNLQPIPGLTRVVQMAGSIPYAGLYLDSGGAVRDEFGSPFLGLPPIAQLAAQVNYFGGNSWFALDFEGRLWVWGENGEQQLGLGPSAPSQISIPVQVSRVRNLLSIFPTTARGKDYFESRGLTFAYGSWDNSPPVAVGETLSQYLAGETHRVNIGANDSDEANLLRWEVVSSSPELEFLKFDGAEINFRSRATFSGTTSFTYRVTDGFLTSSTVTCVIPIRANLPPTANPDWVSAQRGIRTEYLGLLANDTDPENRLAQEIQVVTPPSRAAFFFSSGSRVIYQALPNAEGTDSFTYRCSDGAQWSEPTTVTIQITEPDLRKISIPDNFQIPNDTVSFPAPGVFFNDLIDGPVLEVETDSDLSLNLDGSFTFTPTTGSEWNDRYRYTTSYRFRTASGWSEWAVVTLETTPYYTSAYPNVYLHDVNKGGVAVGYGQSNFVRTPWHRLRSLEGTAFGAVVLGINDFDLCVGEAFFDLSINRPVQWGPDGKIVDLGTLGGPIGIANDVDEDGTIVGWAEDRAGEAWATTWKNGRIAKIPGVSKDSEAIAIDSQFIYLVEELPDGKLIPKVYQRTPSTDRPVGLYSVSLPSGVSGVAVENKRWVLSLPRFSNPGFTAVAKFEDVGGLRLVPEGLDRFGTILSPTPSLPGSWLNDQGAQIAALFSPLTPIWNYVYQWQSQSFRWEEIADRDRPHFAVNGFLGNQMIGAVISPEATPVSDPGTSRTRGIGDVTISSEAGARSSVVEGGQSFYLNYVGGDEFEYVTFTVLQGTSALQLGTSSFSHESADFPVKVETKPVTQAVTVELRYLNSRPERETGTEIFTVVPALPVVALTVDLPDFGGDPETRAYTLSVVRDGSTVLEVPVDFGYNLVAIQKLALVDGVYDFVLKGSHWLAKRVNGVSVESGKTAQLSFSLINGDADGDNAVTVFDYIALSLSFGLRSDDAGFDQNADFDGDGEVTIFDYILLSQNFDLQGD